MDTGNGYGSYRVSDSIGFLRLVTFSPQWPLSSPPPVVSVHLYFVLGRPSPHHLRLQHVFAAHQRHRLCHHSPRQVRRVALLQPGSGHEAVGGTPSTHPAILLAACDDVCTIGLALHDDTSMTVLGSVRKRLN